MLVGYCWTPDADRVVNFFVSTQFLFEAIATFLLLLANTIDAAGPVGALLTAGFCFSLVALCLPILVLLEQRLITPMVKLLCYKERRTLTLCGALYLLAFGMMRNVQKMCAALAGASSGGDGASPGADSEVLGAEDEDDANEERRSRASSGAEHLADENASDPAGATVADKPAPHDGADQPDDTMRASKEAGGGSTAPPPNLDAHAAQGKDAAIGVGGLMARAVATNEIQRSNLAARRALKARMHLAAAAVSGPAAFLPREGLHVSELAPVRKAPTIPIDILRIANSQERARAVQRWQEARVSLREHGDIGAGSSGRHAMPMDDTVASNQEADVDD